MKPEAQNVIRIISTQVVNLKFVNSAPFDTKDEKLDLDISHSINAIKGDNHHFIVDFDIQINNDDKSLVVNAKFNTLFGSDEEVSSEFFNSTLAQKNAPAMAFPFLRSFISFLSLNAGYDAIILPPIDFTAAKLQIK